MNKKLFVGLIILGMIFVGSAAYALFSENPILNVASNIQTNDILPSNNQSTIQNNKTISVADGENSNMSLKNMANIISNDIDSIGDIDVDNDKIGLNIVKEVSRVTINNQTHIFYEDHSYIILMNGEVYNFDNDILKPVYDTNTLDGGYVMCSDCGKFIPVGNVLGLVSEKYLCQCPDEHPTSVKDVTFVYTEESVLQNTLAIENSAKLSNDSLNVDSANTENINNINNLTE